MQGIYQLKTKNGSDSEFTGLRVPCSGIFNWLYWKWVMCHPRAVSPEGRPICASKMHSIWKTGPELASLWCRWGQLDL